jgi:putative phosphoserine phosphatase/1-acylglycerol-3-phosphate O-acyltransferase
VADPSGKQQRTTFFDVDGTLLPPPSTERRFFRWLLTHRNIGLRHVARGVLSMLADFPWSAARFKANKAYLGGEPVDRFQSLGAGFVTAAIVPIVRREAREAIERHRRDGDRIVLLTGTLDLLARPLARALAIDGVVCGQLEQWDGRFTGRSLSPHPYGEGKAAALRDYARREGIDLAQAALYSDDWSDLPALRLVGRPTLVNPSPRLRQLAEQRGLTVADWVDG